MDFKIRLGTRSFNLLCKGHYSQDIIDHWVNSTRGYFSHGDTALKIPAINMCLPV